MTDEDWPFEQAPNTAILTTLGILEKRLPILRVTHDADDGGWQFLDGKSLDVATARIVALKEIVHLDPSVLQLASLPLGASAERSRPAEDWSINIPS
jgi:hypothetical protein